MTAELPPLQVQRLAANAVIPSAAHPGDAGLDLVSVESHRLEPGGRAVVGVGLAVAIPEGWVGLVCPRSGLAARHGIGVVNAPGVVDSGYRGELRVVLLNSDSSAPFVVEPGDRIAQLVLVPAPARLVVEVEELPVGDRGAAGFGSTGGFAMQGKGS